MILLLTALPACASLAAPTPPPTAAAAAPVTLPAAVSAAPEEAAPALISAERQAAIDGDLEILAALWAADARIVDGRGTVDRGDDYVWQGRDAILDRYTLAVLPAPPPPLDPSMLDALTVIAAADGAASAQLGIDRWTLTRQGGRWWLSELRYD